MKRFKRLDHVADIKFALWDEDIKGSDNMIKFLYDLVCDLQEEIDELKGEEK